MNGQGRIPMKRTTNNTNNRAINNGKKTSGASQQQQQHQQQQQQRHRSQPTKIIIKPFAKPPKLPDNYYEETATLILKGTLQFLEQRNSNYNNNNNNNGGVGTQQKQSSNSSSSISNTSNSNFSSDSSTNKTSDYPFSFQSAYNNTVHLVSHQFGGRLYCDLVQTLQKAAEQVLQPQDGIDMDTSATFTGSDGSDGVGFSLNKNSSNSNNNNNKIMHYIVEQYMVFTDYLMLCKHVLTPLDRTWQWQDSTQRAIPISTTSTIPTTTSATTSKSSSGSISQGGGVSGVIVSTSTDSVNHSTASSSGVYPLQNIWQVGLTCFLRRLQSLKMDQLLYKQWLATFLYDWGNSTSTSTTSRTFAPYNNGNESSSSMTTSRQTLQQVWYIWQDLGLLNHLTIHQDLEQYWGRVSLEWANSTSSNYHRTSSDGSGDCGGYPIAQFIMFCYEKHLQCYNYRQWLPIVWLWKILDVQLFQPHMLPLNSATSPTFASGSGGGSGSGSRGGGATKEATPLLLQDHNLHPILQDALFQQKQHHQQLLTPIPNSSSGNIVTSTSHGNMKWTNVQILWMLAGRLQGGQRALTIAIQRFARIQGLQCVQTTTTTTTTSTPAAATSASTDSKQPPQAPSGSTSTSNVAGVSTTTTTTTNGNAVEALLQLQDSLSAMIQTLPITTLSQSGGGGGGGGVVLLPNSPLPTLNYANYSNTTSIISLKSVWEEVVNVETQPSIGEQLAKFLDSILKSNKKIDMYQNQHNMISSGVSTLATGATAAQSLSTTWLQRIVMGLFVPLSSKDVFEAFYKKDLAKRLLWGRVVSMDIEKQVCSLLKAECGAGFTAKMEGMFQDIEWSRESMHMYKESVHYTSKDPSVSTDVKPVEMEVQVLTTGYWPVYPQYPNLHLPASFQQPQLNFSKYYKTKYQGRRMTWQYALGHCMVRANGFNKPYELLVSMCQALTLLQFTAKDNSVKTGGWTLPALQRAIGLDDRDEMERILQSLALGKDGTRILRKIDYDRDTSVTSPVGKRSSPLQKNKAAASAASAGAGAGAGATVSTNKKVRPNVDDKDLFIVNVHFDSPVRRIRINNILMKETKEEHDKTVEGISRDRLYLIDAVLVRIMKARKTIAHQQLIPQVLEQIKVPAMPSDIKKRIESLIEREYMERDAKDRNRYNYLA